MKRITIKKKILSINDDIAQKNRAVFQKYNITAFNVMGSPGAGKTEFIIALNKFTKKRTGVIEGDIASRIDAERIEKLGIPVVQINTGGNCHLEAVMIERVLDTLPLKTLDYIFIENVGNLVCPANFALGTHKNIVISSVAEGDEKPYKYPGMFQVADIVIVSKVDIKHVFSFDTPYFSNGVRLVNTNSKIIEYSSVSKKGIDESASLIFK